MEWAGPHAEAVLWAGTVRAGLSRAGSLSLAGTVEGGRGGALERKSRPLPMVGARGKVALREDGATLERAERY